MKFIIKFVKSVWNWIRALQSFVGTILFIFLLGFVVLSLSSGQKITIPDDSAIVISLEGVIREQRIYDSNPLRTVASGEEEQSQTILREVIKAIDLAASDERIKMLVLKADYLRGAMPSKLHYIGDALSRFRQSGKKVVTYGASFSQAGYLVASYADEIYLHPYGAVLLYGYGSYKNYYKDFLKKIKAEVQLFRVGKYKSAMEPFIRSDMSPEAREASMELLGEMWGQYIDRVALERDMSVEELTQGVENADSALEKLGGDLAALALDYKLVDGLKTRAEWVEYLKSQVGENAQSGHVNAIHYRAYLAARNGVLEGGKNKNKIAVVYANGTIMDGSHPQGTAGGDTVSRHLREAREDSAVKAVVLRVDSPGGSAFASELIRQEVLLLKKAGKPVVVSMGSLAASGGYWISANADEIWASPTTITGSIGIFGMIPNFEGTLGAMGIATDGVGTTSLSMSGVSKPLPKKISRIIQSNIENGYDRFLNIVAEGRGMTVEAVNEIAQGRVWTGIKAKELGLVDQLGSFEDAVKSTAGLAEIETYDLVYWEDEIPFEEKLIAQMIERFSGAKAVPQSRNISPEKILLDQIKAHFSLFTRFNDPNHAYVLCMSCLSSVEAFRD